jgi:hypothetical protein
VEHQYHPPKHQVLEWFKPTGFAFRADNNGLKMIQNTSIHLLLTCVKIKGKALGPCLDFLCCFQLVCSMGGHILAGHGLFWQAI